MNRIRLLAVLLVFSLGMKAAALDYRDARQTAGIYVHINGRMHSVFGDFSAVRYLDDVPQEVSFTLSSDLEFWVEGIRIPSGKKDWTFRVDAEGGWTLGPRNGDDDAARFLIPQEESRSSSTCLAASFHPDPAANAVVLRLCFGQHVGELRFFLERGESGSSAALASLDLIKGRRELARLREIAGILEAERAKRPAWSGILADLGAAMIGGGDDVDLTRLTFSQSKKDITLTVTGQAAGGQRVADEIAAALRVGSAPSLFPDVSRPVARLADGGKTWNFEVTATAPLSKWNSVAKVDALSDGRDASAVALEMLLLETRISEATATAPLGVPDIQPRLLEAKRSAGVMLSHVTASNRTEEHGLVRFPVKLRVIGSGAAVITFVRNLEDCGAPLTIVPAGLDAGMHSCELDLTVVFYDYVSLATREPAMNGLIAPLRRRPGFRDKVDLYLQGSGATSPAPFVPPEWRRDPFVISGE